MNDYSKIPDHLADKLRKLLAMQDGTSNPHEAANAAQRIQELLLKYNLDLNNLGEKEPPIIEAYIGVREMEIKNEGEWAKKLLVKIASFYFCKAIYWESNKGRIYSIKILGEEINTQLLLFTHDQLIVRIRYMAKQAVKTYQGVYNPLAFKRAYYMGCVEAISDKLWEEFFRDRKSQSVGYGLIITKKDRIEDYIRDKREKEDLAYLEKYGPIVPNSDPPKESKKKSKEKVYKETSYAAKDAQEMGYADGKTISINKGLDNSTERKQLD